MGLSKTTTDSAPHAIATDTAEGENAARGRTSDATACGAARNEADDAHLEQTDAGLALACGDMTIRGDFTRMLPRTKKNRLQQELLVKAVKPAAIFAQRDAPGAPLVIDATAGLGDDAYLLAACGFEVLMFERDETIAALLEDALVRAQANEETSATAKRMHLAHGDSIAAMRAFAARQNANVAHPESESAQRPNAAAKTSAPSTRPESENAALDGKDAAPVIARKPAAILLDPMFPARTKSAAVKKKFQLIHQLEKPCADEDELVRAALAARPLKVIVKRPAKGPFLAGLKPSYSIGGKAVRYDVLVPAQMKL